MATKVVVVPAQMAEGAAMATLGTAELLSVIVMPLEVTTGDEAQSTLLVSMQATESLLFKVLSIYVGEFVPTLISFFIH